MQSYALIEKIKQVDAAMTPETQQRVFEVHPEISFWALNGKRPMSGNKKTATAARARLELLSEAFSGPISPSKLRRGFARDDVLDACAAAWTAWRFATGQHRTLPASPTCDSRGLRMEIVY